MSDPLATYLHDHLAGARSGVELVKTLRDQHEGEPLGAFAATLLVEIEKDVETLQGIIGRTGKEPPAYKQAAGWLGEKVTQLKLRREVAGELGTFEALESLRLGIQGKLALWQALPEIAKHDARINGIDTTELAARAENQQAKVEEHRLQKIREAFGPAKD